LQAFPHLVHAVDHNAHQHKFLPWGRGHYRCPAQKL
jgi:hypothetical protein